VRDEELLGLLRDAARAVADAIVGQHGRGLSGERPTQYLVDVAADDAALGVLLGGGLQVVSEESGHTGDRGLVCVIDPIDGSTNFDRGIPFYSTSMCVLDDEGPRCSLVVNLATDTWYEAARGAGATKDGEAIKVSDATEMREAIIGFSGLPREHGGWAQYRALGSAALELCAVADGSLDGYAVAAGARLSPWDYLGGMLVVTEAGGVVTELDGAPLVEATRARRRPVAAATASLAARLAEFLGAERG
jgi:fructose-1,6-bisphosphatase/inositol monophosphatase family enzyme